MKFTPDQIQIWNDMYEHGDYDAISKESGFHVVTIRAAFNDGKATTQVIDAIHKFYLARKQKNDERIAEMNGTSTKDAA